MNRKEVSILYIVATGCVVLVLFSLALYWPRKICTARLADLRWKHARYEYLINLPLGQVPELKIDVPKGPGGQGPARSYGFMASLNNTAPGFFTGMGQDLLDERIGFQDTLGTSSILYLSIYHQPGSPRDVIYFDRTRGLLVAAVLKREANAGEAEFRWIREVTVYAGPGGVSRTPDKKLGRFVDLVTPRLDTRPDKFAVYDRRLRRFFQVNFGAGSVAAGSAIPADGRHEPVQIESIEKHSWNVLCVNMSHQYKSEKGSPHQIDPLKERHPQDHALVLDRSGRIDRYSFKEDKFVGQAGQMAPPDQLLAYKVIPFARTLDKEYHGLAVGTLDYSGERLTLSLFDEDGRPGPVMTAPQTKPPDAPISYADPRNLPGGALYLAVEYVLEGLYPPVVQLGSLFSRPWIEATDARSTVFLLPLSIMTNTVADETELLSDRLIKAAFLFAPPVLLAVVLAWRVRKDALGTGLGSRAAQRWFVGTLLLGLVGWLTYRLVRPRVALVTCPNCGRSRRPDLATCHHCRAPWPETDAATPLWRVMNCGTRMEAGQLDTQRRAVAEE